MESLKHLLFEDPVPVCVAMAAAEAVVWWLWRSRRTRRWALRLLVPPAVAGAVILAARLVETDREEITRALHEIAASAQAGHLDAARRYLDPACRMPLAGGGVVGPAEMIDLGRRALKRHRVARVTVSAVEITLAGGRATATLTTQVMLPEAGLYALRWQVQWARRPAGWRIVRVEPARPELVGI